MVLFAPALVQPTLNEGYPLLQRIQTMCQPLLVSFVGSGTIAGKASGRCFHVIVHQETELDCQ